MHRSIEFAVESGHTSPAIVSESTWRRTLAALYPHRCEATFHERRHHHGRRWSEHLADVDPGAGAQRPHCGQLSWPSSSREGRRQPILSKISGPSLPHAPPCTPMATTVRCRTVQQPQTNAVPGTVIGSVPVAAGEGPSRNAAIWLTRTSAPGLPTGLPDSASPRVRGG